MTRTEGYTVQINTHTCDTNAVIVLADGVLIGILSELSDECHGADRGKRAIEIAFGVDEQPSSATLASASAAANWLSIRTAGASFEPEGRLPELH